MKRNVYVCCLQFCLGMQLFTVDPKRKELKIINDVMTKKQTGLNVQKKL